MRKLLLVGVVLLAGCAPDDQTISLSSVPEIPKDMVREQGAIHAELEKDRQEVLDEIK